ncbi:6-O-methylguanine DNA methyltransferase, DNA binding domain [Rhizobiales bacterium GAS191]|nr:6-O-methylguanine DNA methyltransferase, DNA binding domain [Rhizobiales bacterium GAS191]
MVRRSVDDELRSDVLVDIPKEQERRFGCAGKMLKPSRASVEALVAKVPRGMVLTTTLLRKVLAEQHDAQVTCPFLTKRALMAIAEDPETTAPYWRVVMGSGEMMTTYPGRGIEQARRLRSEGVRIAGKIGRSRVANLNDNLAAL